MVFNSYPFLFAFLPIVLTGTFLLARFRAAAAQLWLIAASLFSYAAWNVSYVPLLLGSIGFNYLIASRMARSETRTTRSRLLGFAVTVDLALLGYYKYTGFFMENLNAATGSDYTFQSLILPLGISFWTFQQLTLLADISSGQIKDFRFRDFLLFVTFFPHLIAGPIVHHREMMPQFKKADYRLNGENLAIGFVLLSMGLFKKVILADGIADPVAPIFAAAAGGHPIAFAAAWGASIGFTLQMYFDFSGYSDMALGLARMVGIRLPMNFNSPLKALSIVDYWSRWHITLTRFLTAYIYNPIALSLARRRAAAGKRGLAGTRTTWSAFAAIVAAPTLMTMFLSGLWHGAGNQFLIFGLLHGVALVINHAWRLISPRFWPDTARYRRATKPFAWALTFLVVTVALTWFHAGSVAAGGGVVTGMIGLHGVMSRDDAAGSFPLFGWIAPLMVIALVPPNALEILRDWRPAITMPAVRSYPWRVPAFSLSPLWAFATAALLVIGVLGLNHVSEFLYWQF
jgi:alginate O-acetyltransferase complex protein AlgI